MHYLTVQDVLWIHLQIAKKPGKFSFANLEEATSYQYAYGKSHNFLAQAARFFGGFATKAPFDSANRAVAFAAGIVFLELNGYQLNPEENDLVAWLAKASIVATIEGSTTRTEHAHVASSRDVAQNVLDKYASTIKMLTE